MGGSNRALPSFYDWLHRGRLYKIWKVTSVKHLGHGTQIRRYYWFMSRRSKRPAALESYHLRRPEERQRR